MVISGANGSFILMTTVWSPSVSNDATRGHHVLARLCNLHVISLNENTTSCAVKGMPSCHLTSFLN